MELAAFESRKRSATGDGDRKWKARKVNCSDCNSPAWEESYCSRCGHFVPADKLKAAAGDDDQMADFLASLEADAPAKKDVGSMTAEEEKAAENAAAASDLKAEGNAHVKAKRYADAVGCYTDAIKLTPNNAVLWSNRSAALLSMPSPADALVSAKQCVAADPKFAKGYSRLGAAYVLLHDHGSALAAYKKGLEVEPSNSAMEIGASSAEASLKAGAVAPAVSDTSRMASGPREDGNQALKRGQYSLAMRHYTEAIKLAPKNHELWGFRSAAAYGYESYIDALVNAEECIRLDPKQAAGYLHKGKALSKLSKHDEAAEAFEKGLEIEPENAELKAGLDEAMNAEGDFDDFEAAMSRAL